MSRRLLLLLISVTMISMFAVTAFGAPQPRAFAPVQNGYTPTAPTVLPYATDHVIVKFTRSAMQSSNLQMTMRKSATPVDGLTGLVSVDAMNRKLGVTRVSRPYDLPNDMGMVDQLGIDRWFRFDFDGPVDIEAMTRQLQADANIEHATPDWKAFPMVTPNDPLHASNWGHNNTAQLPGFDWGGSWDHTLAGVGTVGFDTNAELAWGASQGYGSSGVVIAIIDSGVDAGHPDLNQVAGYDYGNNDSNPDDDSGQPGHGTACAGVAAAIANNNLGASGAAGGCSIMPLKAADTAGDMYFSAIINCIYFAANNGADVISMSLGLAGVSSDPSTDAALQYAYNAGVTILAATGNENDTSISYPAVNTNVIAVGAASPCGDRKRSSSSAGDLNPDVNADPNGYTCDGERWWGSNYGVNTQDSRFAVDVIAPTILPTTDIQGSGGYASGDYSNFFNGTSCATPYAAGVCALIKSANPGWTPAQITAQLTSTAIDIINVESGTGWDRYSGYGMVDAAAAVGAGSGPQPPVASFTANILSGCSPLPVGFTDLSSQTPTSWFWDFGDGNTSTQQNPLHYYTTGGAFDVTLIATNAAGSDTLVMSAYITVDQIVVTDFIADVMVGTAPLTVNFTDISTGSPTNWIWVFGDGGNALIQNPTYVYTAPGLYTVSLNAYDACGNNVMTKPAFIDVQPPLVPPVADFMADITEGCPPMPIQFQDLSTGDFDTWAWDFGDGGTSTEPSPMHEYTTTDTFTVSLTVSGLGGIDTMTKTDYIIMGEPVVAEFSASVVYGGAPLSVDFSDLSTGDPISWSWDFGDATTDTLQNPTHVYTAPGLYQVTLTVDNGCSGDQMVKTDYIDIPAYSDVKSLPTQFAMHQNYPNPFNPSTTIKFALTEAEHARLEVFDSAGRRVDVLVDKQMAPGNHRVVWQPTKQSSGVYFARLTAGRNSATMRLVLLK
jgi:PKD repeat protein